MLKRYKALKPPRLDLKSGFWLFIIMAITTIEILLMGSDMSFTSMLVLSVFAVLSVIAFDVSRILRMMEKEGVERAIRQERLQEKIDAERRGNQDS